MHTRRPLVTLCATCRRQLSTSKPTRRPPKPQPSKPQPTKPPPKTKAPAPPRRTANPYTLRAAATAPTPAQLKHADTFFQSNKRRFLLSTPKFQLIPPSSLPEICFIGRSNVGKSSLLNAVFAHAAVDGAKGRDELAHTSRHAGRTKAMVAFACGDMRQANPGGGEGGFERWEGMNSLVVMDTPGYGHASQEEWGREVLKYLGSRKQLRRVYVLVDAEHGLKQADKMMMEILAGAGVSHQIVLTKFDKILWKRKSKQTAEPNTQDCAAALEQMETILSESRQSGRGLLSPEILACSAEAVYPLGSGKKGGIAELRHAILEVTGLAKDWSDATRQPQGAIGDVRLITADDGTVVKQQISEASRS